jgi:mRNA interferase MazF
MKKQKELIYPHKWHIYIVDLEPRIGSKPGKQRPCLCIQPTNFCENGLNSAVIFPLTTNTIKQNAFPLRVKIPKGICGLNVDSDVLIDQVLAWDISLFREDLGEIPVTIQKTIKEALIDFLDL